MPDVRKATKADVPRLGAMLGRAFYDDPVTAWSFRNDRTRLKWATRFFTMRLAALLRQDEVHTTTDLSGCAIWALPDKWKPRPLEVLRAYSLFPGVARNAMDVLRGLDRLEHAHPEKPPHYYLAVLGTEPERQGEGIGSAVLQPVLEECDRLEIGAYLESSKERNVHFYGRHGFRVTDELTMPNGPPVWLMWRDSR